MNAPKRRFGWLLPVVILVAVAVLAYVIIVSVGRGTFV